MASDLGLHCSGIYVTKVGLNIVTVNDERIYHVISLISWPAQGTRHPLSVSALYLASLQGTYPRMSEKK